jgi:hypothetical protein
MSDTTAAAPDAPSLAGILGQLFTAPREAFASLLPRPRWWIALAGVMALNLGFTAVWMSEVDPREFMTEQIEASPRAANLAPEQKAQVMEQQLSLFPVFAWMGPVFVAILVFFVAALYLFLFRFVRGGDITFGGSMGVVAWSFLAVGLISVPLLLGTIALKDEWNADPRTALLAGPAAFLDKADTPAFLYSLLESIDLFTLWTLWLMAVGYAVAHRKPTGWAVATVFVPWAVYVLGKAALAGVF